MNAINLTDMINAANDAQAITHALSMALRQLAAGAAIDIRHHLTVLAAAAELASDKATLIVEGVGEAN